MLPPFLGESPSIAATDQMSHLLNFSHLVCQLLSRHLIGNPRYGSTGSCVEEVLGVESPGLVGDGLDTKALEKAGIPMTYLVFACSCVPVQVRPVEPGRERMWASWCWESRGTLILKIEEFRHR